MPAKKVKPKEDSKTLDKEEVLVNTKFRSYPHNLVERGETTIRTGEDVFLPAPNNKGNENVS